MDTPASEIAWSSPTCTICGGSSGGGRAPGVGDVPASAGAAVGAAGALAGALDGAEGAGARQLIAATSAMAQSVRCRAVGCALMDGPPLLPAVCRDELSLKWPEPSTSDSGEQRGRPERVLTTCNSIRPRCSRSASANRPPAGSRRSWASALSCSSAVPFTCGRFARPAPALALAVDAPYRWLVVCLQRWNFR